MQVIRGISRPLPGERPLDVVPPLAAYVRPEAATDAVRRRLNLFPQRAMSHVALTQEQRSRSFDTSLLAQAVAPGVIAGLEVALARARLRTDLYIGPGHALTVDGYDLELAYPLRLDPDLIPVDAASVASWTTPADGTLNTRAGAGENIALREFMLDAAGPARALRRDGLLPHALVLVAQPVTVALNPAEGDLAACQNATDQTQDSGLVWEDGFRLVWVPWPAARPMPLWTQDGSTMDSRFRNRLAYAIFDDERRPLQAEGVRSVRRMTELRTADDPAAPRRRGEPPPPPTQRAWPWEELGVALSIVGFDAQFRPLFCDRAAVVRQGGGRRNRTPLLRMAGEDVLWQARVAQMLEQVAELPPEDRLAARLVQHFERLPPAGLLALDAVDFETGRQKFFPPSFDVQAQPVPIDMVDALLAESASLAALNLSAAEQVQLLVPVPARFFDPELLNLDERIHPLFDLEIARLEGERLRLLQRRDALRRRFDLLSKAVSGRLPGYPEDDPDALTEERGALDAVAFARVRQVRVLAGNSVGWHGFTTAQVRLHLTEADALMVFVRINSPVSALSLRMRLPNGALAGVYWGAREVTAAPLMVSAGPLPQDDNGQPMTQRWMRLTAPVTLLNRNASGGVIANPLVGVALDNLEFGVLSGNGGVAVTWGYCGSVSGGIESYWVADAWPPGGRSTGTGVQWGADQGGLSEAENNSWGVSVEPVNGTFVVDDLKGLRDAFASASGGLIRELGEDWPRAAWTGYVDGKVSRQRPALTRPSSLPPLIEQGLDTLIARLAQRIAAADDHVEVGFLRARTDIFRLRQGVLGTAVAGRLLTSPAAADLVQRAESAVATEKVFAEYFQRVSLKPPQLL